MKILISSHVFLPSVGGIEQVTSMLAENFSLVGHDVCVVTQTFSEYEPILTYKVVRKPSLRRLFSLLSSCDVYIQNNISLLTLWPAFLLGTRIFIVHQTWMRRVDGGMGFRDWLKLFATCCVDMNFAISRAIGMSILGRHIIVPNPYRATVFKLQPDIAKDRDIIFVGRLVSDKGCALLLEALHSMKAFGLSPSVTIVGTGPEDEHLRLLVAGKGLNTQVIFAGQKTGHELSILLNRHTIMAVPSLWDEPFGVVALEGIACGCVVVGSAGGGLPDAIGPCGVTFQNGNYNALAEVLIYILNSPRRIEELRLSATVHLARHSVQAVGEVYLRELKRLVSVGQNI